MHIYSCISVFIGNVNSVRFLGAYSKILTVTTTESLATRAMMSAQETIPGQAASTVALTLSTKSNPLRVRFGVAAFSVWLLEVEFRRTDASQP